MSRPESRRELLTALAASVLVALLLLAPLPEVEEVPTGPGGRWLDELIHLLLFALLAEAWRRVGAVARRGTGLLAVGAALLAYGALLELAQGATGWRTAEWGDLGADALGVALAVGWAARRGYPARTPVDSR